MYSFVYDIRKNIGIRTHDNQDVLTLLDDMPTICSCGRCGGWLAYISHQNAEVVVLGSKPPSLTVKSPQSKQGYCAVL